MNKLMKSFLFCSLVVFSALFSLSSCEGGSVPVYATFNFDPKKNESEKIIIKQGDGLTAFFFMATKDNPECADYFMWINDETESKYETIDLDNYVTVQKGYIVNVGYSKDIYAVPYTDGKELEVTINNLTVGCHKLDFCICSIFNGKFGLVRSEYPSIYSVDVIVEE